MKSCCVTGCKNTSRKNGSTSFFLFPLKNESLLKQWKQVIPIKGIITKYTCICSDHFTDTSFNIMSGTRYLKKNAVPTIFNYGVLHDIIQSQPRRNCIPTMSTSKISTSIIHCETQTSPIVKNDVGTQISPRRLAPSNTEEQLRKKIKVLQSQLRRREKRIGNTVELLKRLRSRNHDKKQRDRKQHDRKQHSRTTSEIYDPSLLLILSE